MGKDIENRIKHVERIVSSTINGSREAKPYVRLIMLLCAIDTAANYWCGIRSVDCSGFVFKSFIKAYLDEKYESLLARIYSRLRCCMVHAFSLGKGIALSPSWPGHHLMPCKEEIKELPAGVKSDADFTVICLDEFERDVLDAISKYIQDVKSGFCAPKFVDKKGYKAYAFKDKIVGSEFMSSDEYKLVSELMKIVPSIKSAKTKISSLMEDEKVKLIGLLDVRRDLKAVFANYDFIESTNENEQQTLQDNLKKIMTDKDSPVLPWCEINQPKESVSEKEKPLTEGIVARSSVDDTKDEPQFSYQTGHAENLLTCIFDVDYDKYDPDPQNRYSLSSLKSYVAESMVKPME